MGLLKIKVPIILKEAKMDFIDIIAIPRHEYTINNNPFSTPIKLLTDIITNTTTTLHDTHIIKNFTFLYLFF